MRRKALGERSEDDIAFARSRFGLASAQLPDQIAAELRERILCGDLRAGDFLRPDRIGDELGVSPTPVREALHVLRADDLVHALPRRGFVVSPPGRQDIIDMFTVASDLTGQLVARAVARATSHDLEHLDNLAGQVDACIRRVDSRCDDTVDDGGRGREPNELVEIEHAFHVAINRLADARKLAWLAGRATAFMPRTFYTRNSAWRSAASRAHRTLLTAMAGADIDGARVAMCSHVLDGRDLLLAHLGAIGLWDEAPDTTCAGPYLDPVRASRRRGDPDPRSDRQETMSWP